MDSYRFEINQVTVEATPTGALWLESAGILVFSDLHLGKAERIARREGRLTPPYETAETLARLSALVQEATPRTVICLGDSFDDGTAAAHVAAAHGAEIAALTAGRRWIWIAGNHDPGPVGLGGSFLAEISAGGLTFRHEALPGAGGEVSGHYHPKAWLRGRGRPAFLVDTKRVILPAFGLYTGGLNVTDPVFDALVAPDALVLLTGPRIIAAPRAMLSRALKPPFR